MITGACGVAGEAQDVMYAEDVSAEEVGLECDPVAVPAGELADGLDSPVEDNLAEWQWAEPHNGGVLISHVDRVDGRGGSPGRDRFCSILTPLGASSRR